MDDPIQDGRMAPPRTIKEYKAALLRLGVPLPAGQVRLADYQALWHSVSTARSSPPQQEATTALADATNTLDAHEASSGAKKRRSFGNVPLSLQSPTLPSEPPAAAAQPCASPAQAEDEGSDCARTDDEWPERRD